MARAQPVLLFERARVLQRTLFRAGDLPSPARGRNAALSGRSRLAASDSLLSRPPRAGRRDGRLLILGAAGIFARSRRRILVAAVFLALGAGLLRLEHAFLRHAHLCSELWPFSWYNTRYALAAVAFGRLCGGASGTVAYPQRFRLLAALVMGLIAARGLCLERHDFDMLEGIRGEFRSPARLDRAKRHAIWLRTIEPGRESVFLWRSDRVFCARPAFPFAKACMKATIRSGTRPWPVRICCSRRSGCWSNAGDDLDTAVRKAR